MLYTIKHLNNGIPVLIYKSNELMSAHIGITAMCGGITENENNSGISHLLEHMLFKGSVEDKPSDISIKFDSLSAKTNAWTDKEYTFYWASAPTNTFIKTASELARLYVNKSMNTQEFENEKEIVCEEINNSLDSPSTISNLYQDSIVYDGSPIAMSLYGTKDHVKAFTSDDLLEYKNKYYTAKNTVIAVAGKFNVDGLMDALNEAFKDINTGEFYLPDHVRELESHTPKIGKFWNEYDCEQVYIGMASPLEITDLKQIFTIKMASLPIGGTMGSRFFRILREENAFCYSTHTHPEIFRTMGAFWGACTTSRDKVDKAVNKMEKILLNINKRGINRSEARRGKDIFKASLARKLESPEGMLNHIYDMYTITGEVLPVKEYIKIANSITTKEISDMSMEMINPDKLSITLTGNE